MGLLDWVKSLASRSSAAEVQARRGVAYLKAGKLYAACDAFREAISKNPSVAANYVNLAYCLQQIGQANKALEYLRHAVAIDATSFDAHYMLAGALERSDDLELAAEHLKQAVILQGDFEPARSDLCRVLALNGDLDGARAAIAEAISRNPDKADLVQYLGNVCMTAGNAKEAIAHYARALQLLPDSAQTLLNLGGALYANGEFSKAIEHLEVALTLNPAMAEAHVKVGQALRALERFDAAETSFLRAIELQPDSAETHTHLGGLLQHQAKMDLAIAHYRQSIALNPYLPDTYANLGLALDEAGRTGEAETIYRDGLAIKPIASLHSNLAIALTKLGKIDEAIKHYELTLEMSPDNLGVLCNMAGAWGDSGAAHKAIDIYRNVLEKKPDLVIAHSNLLFYLSVDDRCSPEEYLAEAARFSEKLTTQTLEPIVRIRTKEATNRLRLGFVSGDLRSHPVGLFLEGVLNHIDLAKWELFAYPTNGVQDDLTARLKNRFEHWTQLRGMSDKVAAEKIRADEIDILIDLAGHSADNRLGVFAFKPAPVQLSWLGYFASTGVPAIDYMFVDDVSVPPGNEQFFSEKIWRLPRTRLCYTPPSAEVAPDVAELPALRRGYVTFGSFQRLPKVNDKVLQLWGRVMRALPNARLHIQTVQTGRPATIEQVLERLGKEGIAADRVTMRGPVDRRSYLQAYSEVDIVLDTFPFTGGTTTCEALWMGVPTLTLQGRSMIERQGVAMMHAVDLPDWVAENHDEFVSKAVAFASDAPSLAVLRSSLRPRLPQTALFNGKLFAQHFEEALQSVWREHEQTLKRGNSSVLHSRPLTRNVASPANERHPG